MSNVNTIGKEYTTKQLIGFVASPVITQFVLSLLQTFDDGLFLSRHIGPNGLAAFSIAMPIFMAMNAIAELFCGASVMCATKMGEGKNDQANRIFTGAVSGAALFGLLLTLIFKLIMDPMIRMLGGTDILFPYVKDFFNIAVWYIPLILTSTLFSRFYIPAGKPQYAMLTMLMSAILNFFFDWLFIVELQVGMPGTALANLMANIAVVAFGLWFYRSKQTEIRFAKPGREVFGQLRTCFSFGLPQFFTSTAISVNAFIANQILLKTGGELYVSAYTIVNNIQFMFASCFFGLSSAVCPLLSYAYGEKNNAKIRRIVKQIIQLTTGLVGIVILSYLLGKNAVLKLYLTNESGPLMKDIVSFGLTIAPFGMLFLAYNVMTIDSFMALNDSRTSTTLTILENLVFNNLTLICLPLLFGKDGVWFAMASAEMITFAFTLFFINRNKGKYAIE